MSARHAETERPLPPLPPACAGCGHPHAAHDHQRCWWVDCDSNRPCTCRHYTRPEEGGVVRP